MSTSPDADPDAVIERLDELGVSVEPGPLIPPQERAELAELRTMPLLLAGFLAVLGVGAVTHTLASTARRRRHDVAMLRALGMRPRQTSALLFVQAGALASIGLVIGIPVGLALGRSVWRAVASDTPVEFVEPADWSTMAATAVVVVMVSAVLAVWPSRGLTSMRLAEELRTE